MPRREAEALKRLHVHLYESDYDTLRDLYGQNIGMASAIRKMVRASIRRMEEKAAAKRPGVQIDDAGARQIFEEGADVHS